MDDLENLKNIFRRMHEMNMDMLRLEKDFSSAVIVVQEGRGHYETQTRWALDQFSGGPTSHDKAFVEEEIEKWVWDEPRIEKPDIEKRREIERERAEVYNKLAEAYNNLVEIYNQSEYYSARYKAAKTLAKYDEHLRFGREWWLNGICYDRYERRRDHLLPCGLAENWADKLIETINSSPVKSDSYLLAKKDLEGMLPFFKRGTELNLRISAVLGIDDPDVLAYRFDHSERLTRNQLQKIYDWANDMKYPARNCERSARLMRAVGPEIGYSRGKVWWDINSDSVISYGSFAMVVGIFFGVCYGMQKYLESQIGH